MFMHIMFQRSDKRCKQLKSTSTMTMNDSYVKAMILGYEANELLEQDQLKPAIQKYTQAIALSPTDLRHLFNRSYVYLRSKLNTL